VAWQRRRAGQAFAASAFHRRAVLLIGAHWICSFAERREPMETVTTS
jgi:hypothetical protein